MLRAKLPLPPTANRLTRCICSGGRPRAVTSREYREWKTLAALMLAREIARPDTAVEAGGLPFRGRVAVRIAVALTPYGGDIDNRAKPLLDLLQDGGVLANDSQVERLFIHRAAVRAGGRAYVLVWSLDP